MTDGMIINVATLDTAMIVNIKNPTVLYRYSFILSFADGERTSLILETIEDKYLENILIMLEECSHDIGIIGTNRVWMKHRDFFKTVVEFFFSRSIWMRFSTQKTW